ncbi:hypothetical protein [Streptomyces sp. NPDC002133]|uniref:hypothetical protein n=1 Tax=Streptomyces sp. NPDC002133 TaxID=3154409 RepID=UPI00331EE185
MTADGEDKRLLQIGDDVYAPSDKSATGKPWMRIGLADSEAPGVRLNQDPAEYLAMLLDQDKLRHVSAEKSDGTGTEHYRGTFTLAELLRADSRSKVMKDDRRKALRAALKKAGIRTYKIDIWIGGDGCPVRLEDALTDDKGTSTTKATFSDCGTAPAVKAPPADQVSRTS